MHAVILCAGQGRRLLPLTESQPKCLLPLAGRPVLEWQIRGLAANGITDITVVTGFGAAAVEAAIARMGALAAGVRCRFNPFYAVADNIGSCFMARDRLEAGDLVLLNGDTLFQPAILARALAGATGPVTVTIDRKPAYDSDDMKVSLEGSRLLAIGKTLTPEQSHGESIGMLVFRGEGGRRFSAMLEAVLRQPDGLKRWYLSVIHALAQEIPVGTASIEGLEWGEIDFPADVPRAEALASAWLQQEAARAAE